MIKTLFGRLAITMLIALCSTLTFGQTFWDGLNIKFGELNVGFKNYVKNDATRSYTRLYDWNNAVLPRPISISVWYPSTQVTSKHNLKVSDYMTILKQEEEWESLPNERILSWFYYSDNEQNRKQLEIETKSYFNTQQAKGKFPVIIYAPSYQASSVENFALCEFLASHGYIVLSCPSRGTENRFLEGGTTKDIETQARDIEFLIGEASSMASADPSKLSLIGFSFGGISNVLVQMRNRQVKSLLCLDGSVKYQLKKLLQSSYADLSKVDVPFIFMSQKDIPKSVMIEDKIDTTLNTRFEFYDSLKYSDAYYLKFNHLTHPYFSSMGVLFQDRDLRQDKTDIEITTSYGWVNNYVLHFLDGFIKNEQPSKQFLNNTPIDNAVGEGLISLKSKKAKNKNESFEDFNLLAERQGYKNLARLYENEKLKNASFQLREWKLNNLGLQLIFKSRVQEGIDVLIFNTLLFPNSANTFDSLAEGYLVQGSKDLAAQNFKLSLKLDPQNQNAITKLEMLSKN